MDSSTFYRSSSVFPYLTSVRGIATYPDRVSFEIPQNKDNNTFDIVYDYHFKLSDSFP